MICTVYHLDLYMAVSQGFQQWTTNLALCAVASGLVAEEDWNQ